MYRISAFLLSLLVLTAVPAVAQQPVAKDTVHVIRWQYHWWDGKAKGGMTGFAAHLDSLGVEGWELVAISSLTSVTQTFYFKRPVR